MKHRASPKFWQHFDQLPAKIQSLANDNSELLKSNPRHPSLHFKCVGRFWSVRVGDHYRAISVQDENDFVWFWIGHHSEYDHLIKR